MSPDQRLYDPSAGDTHRGSVSDLAPDLISMRRSYKSVRDILQALFLQRDKALHPNNLFDHYTTTTTIPTMSSTQVEAVLDTEEQLLADLEASKTLPLWKQMARLNPPAPNPTTIPNVWKYSAIRPNLERAGKLVPAEQAERRVLMLTNPARGMLFTYHLLPKYYILCIEFSNNF